MEEINNSQRYLERMSKSLQEKMKIVEHFPSEARDIIDVGCADGTVTQAMAQLFPGKSFLGIDLNEEFIGQAIKKSRETENIKFERVYLRELLARSERFDVIVFCSVLHEFYSYGEGITSVVKAIADACELLRPKGRIIIRDMLLGEAAGNLDTPVSMVEKVKQREDLTSFLKDFEDWFGSVEKVRQMNHFLLKYLYTDNWSREGKENYVPVSLEEYEQLFKLLRMEIVDRELYTIPFLANKWMVDFGFTQEELSGIQSTAILVAEKK